MHIDTNGFEIGDVVKDPITGYQGVVTSVTQWATGCARVLVQAPATKDSVIPEAQGIDVLSLEMVKAGPRHEKQPVPARVGGPRPNPTRGR